MNRIKLLLASAALIGLTSFVVAVDPATEQKASPATTTTSLPTSAEEVKPVTVGTTVDLNIALKTRDGADTTLQKEIGDGPAFLIFYRGGWCPYCNVHLGKLQGIESDLTALGIKIIGISPDSPDSVKSSIEKNNTTLTLLSDAKAVAIQAFGLGFTVGEKEYARLMSYKINIEAASGETHRILPVPAAILVDGKGSVQYIYSKADYKERLSTEDLLTAARAAVK